VSAVSELLTFSRGQVVSKLLNLYMLFVLIRLVGFIGLMALTMKAGDKIRQSWILRRKKVVRVEQTESQ
jgi:hypothetical protein